MKLYETTYSVIGGLKPVNVKGKTYAFNTSEIVSQSSERIQEILKTKSGEYWLHIMIPAVGHYIAPLTDGQAEILIKQDEESNKRLFAFLASL